jgi:hypothetical protein
MVFETAPGAGPEPVGADAAEVVEVVELDAGTPDEVAVEWINKSFSEAGFLPKLGFTSSTT